MNECEERLWQMLHSRDESLMELKREIAVLEKHLREREDVIVEQSLAIDLLKAELSRKLDQQVQLRGEVKQMKRERNTFPERRVLRYIDTRLDEMRKSWPFLWILQPKFWKFRSLKHDIRRRKKSS